MSTLGGRLMARYFYSWTPLVVVGTVVLFALPWLGLLALMLFVLVVLATLVLVPYALGRAASGLWHLRTTASPRPVAVMAQAGRLPTPSAIAASIAKVPPEPGATSTPPEPRRSLLV